MIVLAWILVTAQGLSTQSFPDFADCDKIKSRISGSECLNVKVFAMKPMSIFLESDHAENRYSNTPSLQLARLDFYF